MKLLRIIAPAAAITLALAGCTDVPTAPDSPTAGAAPSSTSGRRVVGTVETPVIERYRVDVSVRGALVPGKPFDVVVSTTNTVDSRAANVRVILPEAAVARHNGWISGKSAVRSRIPADFAATRSLGRDVPHTDVTSVTIGAPGLYRLIVRAASAGDAPGFMNGHFVHDATVRELWLLIDANGGRLVDRFDPRLLPPNVVREPGPTRMLMTPICSVDDPSSCDPPPYDPPPPTTTRAVYDVVATYDNSGDEGSSAEPLRNVRIEVTDYPSGSSFAGQTDDNGRFYATCAVNGTSMQRIVVHLKTPGQFHVQDYQDDEAGMTIVDVIEPAGFCAQGSNTHVQVAAVEAAPAWIHQQLLATVTPSRNMFQVSRTDVAVNYDRYNQEINSLYSPDLDEIFFKAAHLYHYYGRFIISHEYGHALAEQSMNGARGGGCGGTTHSIDSSYTMQCALSEGWADYHSATVRGSAIGGYYNGLRDNYWYHPGDGSLIEGEFASFLMSLTAPEAQYAWNGYDYALHYPYSFVATTIRDCRASYPFSFFVNRVTTASDEVIWCLSGGIDHSVDGVYFTTRRSYDYYFRSSYLGSVNNPVTFPANFSAANVRRNWLARLYGQY